MTINVNYYSLSPRRAFAGTKNSFGIERLLFNFSEEWEGLEKTVVFYPREKAPIRLTYRDGGVELPREVTEEVGVVEFSVLGTSDSKQLVSLTGYLDVLASRGGETA